MSKFLPGIVRAVKEERFRIMYGGFSPNKDIWMNAILLIYGGGNYAWRK